MQNTTAGAVDSASMDPLAVAVRRQFALAEGRGAVSSPRAAAALAAGAAELRADPLSDAEVFAVLRDTVGAQPSSATDRRLRTPGAGGMGPEGRFLRPSATKAAGAAFPAGKATARSLRPKPRPLKWEPAATGARGDPIGAPPLRSRNRLGAAAGAAMPAGKATARLLRPKLRALKRERAPTGVPGDPIGAPSGRGRNRLGAASAGAARPAGPALEPSSAAL